MEIKNNDQLGHQIYCCKHQTKKDYLFCLNEGCNHRLGCKQCYIEDNEHQGHKVMMIEHFIKNDQNELERILGHTYNQIYRQDKQVGQLGIQLDYKLQKYLDEREEEIRTPFEQMLSEMRASTQKWLQKQYNRFRIDDISSIQQIQSNVQNLIDSDGHQQQQLKQQIDRCNQVDQIQKQLDNIMDQFTESTHEMIGSIQKLVQQYKKRQNKIVKYQMLGDEWVLKELRDNQHTIIFRYDNNLEHYRNMIHKYEEQEKEYKIFLDFKFCDTSLEFKMDTIRMIEELECNNDVGMVQIGIRDTNEINNELIQLMIKNYQNIYHIDLVDQSDQVHPIHQSIKSLVDYSNLLEFRLLFHNCLFENDDGFQLLKQYNKILQTKSSLEYLRYEHFRMDKYNENNYGVQQIINELDSI